MLKRAPVPTLPFKLEIGEPLQFFMDDLPIETLQESLASALGGLMAELGIPGKPEVQLNTLPDRSPSGETLRLWADQRACRYPNELLLLAYSYASGRHITPDEGMDQIWDWLDRSRSSGKAGSKPLLEFLGLACVEMAKRQPGALMGSDQAAAYLASLPPPTNGSSGKRYPDARQVRQVLTRVIDQWVSLHETSSVAGILREGFAQQRPVEDIAEDMLFALRPQVIEIRVPRDYLRQITTGEHESDGEAFSLVRNWLLTELGLLAPRFQFVPTQGMKPGSMAFRINHLVTLPQLGLPPGTLLIEQTLDDPKSIPAEALLNTYNGTTAYLAASKDIAGFSGPTRTPLGYLALILYGVLFMQGGYFVDSQLVRDQLDLLENGFPDLVRALRTKASFEQITRLLRGLAAEGLSIQNLPRILECVLNYDPAPLPDTSGMVILGDRYLVEASPEEVDQHNLADLMAYVRIQMSHYIGQKYSGGEDDLWVYTLEPDFEEWIAGAVSQKHPHQPDWLDEQEHDRLLRSVGWAVGMDRYFQGYYPLLTDARLRPYLQQLLIGQFPRLRVIAREEIPSNLPVETLSEIGFAG